MAKSIEARIEALEAASPPSDRRTTIFIRGVEPGEGRLFPERELRGFKVRDRYIARKSGETEQELKDRVSEIAHKESDHPWGVVMLFEDRVPTLEEKQYSSAASVQSTNARAH
jgi:Glu-tRNA(Gln) amidotransferase subunit E-like FAD-binding protein